jgi:hypothetical protein
MTASAAVPSASGVASAFHTVTRPIVSAVARQRATSDLIIFGSIVGLILEHRVRLPRSLLYSSQRICRTKYSSARMAGPASGPKTDVEQGRAGVNPEMSARSNAMNGGLPLGESLQLLYFPLPFAGRSQNDLAQLLLQDRSLLRAGASSAQVLPGSLVSSNEGIQFVRGKVGRIISEGH